MTDWTKALEEANYRRERLPEGLASAKEARKNGWMTMDELHEASPVGATNTRKMLTKGLYEKRMESFEGVVVGGYGKLVRRIWYRPC